MRYWCKLLGGLILWAVHFFTVYAVASVFPGTRLAPVLVLAVTLAILAVTFWLAITTARALRGAAEDVHRWSGRLSVLTYALAAVAIVYQGFPAVLL